LFKGHYNPECVFSLSLRSK